jgi:hypothetical protein
MNVNSANIKNQDAIWDTLFNYSVSFYRFKISHTLLNDIYWNLELTRRLACKGIRGKKEQDEVRNFIGSNIDGHPRYLGQWRETIKENENWIRLNSIISALSYLEKYIYESTTFAILNDPGVLFKCSRSANGVSILKKHGIIENLDKTTELFTKGNWHSRSKQMQTYFRFNALIADSMIDQLEQMRKMRNEISHRFGDSLNSPLPINAIDVVENGIKSRL